MRIKVNDGTLSLWDATDYVPHAEWDNRINEYRYRPIGIGFFSNGLTYGRNRTSTLVI
jgi:hypothetical protein